MCSTDSPLCRWHSRGLSASWSPSNCFWSDARSALVLSVCRNNVTLKYDKWKSISIYEVLQPTVSTSYRRDIITNLPFGTMLLHSIMDNKHSKSYWNDSKREKGRYKKMTWTLTCQRRARANRHGVTARPAWRSTRWCVPGLRRLCFDSSWPRWGTSCLGSSCDNGPPRIPYGVTGGPTCRRGRGESLTPGQKKRLSNKWIPGWRLAQNLRAEISFFPRCVINGVWLTTWPAQKQAWIHALCYPLTHWNPWEQEERGAINNTQPVILAAQCLVCVCPVHLTHLHPDVSTCRSIKAKPAQQNTS